MERGKGNSTQPTVAGNAWKKILFFLTEGKGGDTTLSDEARKNSTQLELYGFANCLSVSRYRVLPARAG